MLRQLMLNNNKIQDFKRSFTSVISSFVLIFLVFGNPIPVSADSISDLQQQNQQFQQQLNSLYAQQNSLSNEIAIADTQAQAIQAQINLSAAKLASLNTQIEDTNRQIATAESDLAKQKVILGEYVRQMYIDGQTSQVQLILTSNNFSDFVDKSQYLNTMQEKVKDSTDKIVALKKELDTKKTQLQVQQDQTNSLLASQSAQKSALDAQNYQKSQLLAQAKNSAGNVATQIAQNNSQINLLRCIASGACNGVANGNLVVVNQPLYYSQKMYGIGGFLYDGYNDLYWEGCLITSLAMAHGITPMQEASHHSYTGGMMIGDATSGRAISWSTANQILSQGGVVIFHLNIGHFVLAIGQQGGKYLINDPFFGAGQSYASSQVDALLAP